MLEPHQRAAQLAGRVEPQRDRESWSAAATASKALGTGNIAARTEMAAFLLATVLNEIGATTKRPDLADVLPAVDALSTYLVGRMVTIVSDLGNADAA